ncbi:MAG: glycosyltransferase family 4 protein [Legionellales bacterium]|nr:glycosyltransferase family 4 protein [Legionellales bacterium]
MKILIFNHYAIPPTRFGGTRHFNLAKKLIQRGHEVYIIASNFDHFSSENIEPAEECKLERPFYFDSVPFIFIPTPKYYGNSIKRFWNMLVYFFKVTRCNYSNFCEKPDIVIGSSPHLFAALGAYYVAKRYKVPFFLEIRDIWPETLIALGKFSQKNFLIILLKKIAKFLYKKSETIISLLPDTKKHIEAQGICKEKIIWLPNFVDTNIQPGYNYTYIKDNFYYDIVYAGTHGLANDLDVLLDAAKLLLNLSNEEKNIRIKLIGDGPEKARLKLRKEKESISNVYFYDPVPKSEIYNFIKSCDACVMLLKDSPLFHWGISPNKLFDYFFMSKPVIFAVSSSYDPVKTAGAGISIPPSCPESMARAIVEMANMNTESQKSMGERGYEYLKKYHDIEQIVDKLEMSMFNQI